MPISTSVNRSGTATTVGATSVEILQVPYTGLTAALMFSGRCIGVDRGGTGQHGDVGIGTGRRD